MRNKLATTGRLEELLKQQIKKYPNQRVRLEKEILKLRLKKERK